MLAARKWTNKEISIHLDVSENTVKSYLASAFRKLGISRRQDLEQYMLK
jgi:DNA-binding CsgD family transcriptional regulator